MEQPRFVYPESFCWNREGPDFGKVGHGNLAKSGLAKKGPQLLVQLPFGVLKSYSRGGKMQ